MQRGALPDRRPAGLSDKQCQRVATGRALMHIPAVVLFNEPLSHLDAMLRGQMRIALARVHSDRKATLIYVTHDQVEAMTLADKVAVLEKGAVQQAGSPLELYDTPADRLVVGCIGSAGMNFDA